MRFSSDEELAFTLNTTLSTEATADSSLKSQGDPMSIICYGTGVFAAGTDINDSEISPDLEGKRLAGEFYFWPTSTERFNWLGTNGPDTSQEDMDKPKPPPSNGPQSDVLCGTYLVSAWLRTNPNPDEGVRLAQQEHPKAEVGATLLACRAAINVVPFNISVDAQGNVLEVEQLGPATTDLKSLADDPRTLHVHEEWPARWFSSLVYNEILGWHDTPFAASWLSHFVDQLAGSLDLVDPSKQLATPVELGPRVEQIMTRFFAIYMSLNRQVFETTPPDTAETNAIFEGTVETTEDRVFFAPKAYQIAVGIISLDILTVTLLLIKRPKRPLPQMPTNIFTVARYVCHSHMLKDLREGKTTIGDMERDDKTYYGK